jgi:hypothetical protein
MHENDLNRFKARRGAVLTERRGRKKTDRNRALRARGTLIRKGESVQADKRASRSKLSKRNPGLEPKVRSNGETCLELANHVTVLGTLALPGAVLLEKSIRDVDVRCARRSEWVYTAQDRGPEAGHPP